jgi:hypothetical protein
MNKSGNMRYRKYIFGSICLFIFSLVLLAVFESDKKISAKNINDLSIKQNPYFTTSNEKHLLLLRETQELPRNGLDPVCKIHNQKMYLGSVQIYHNIANTYGSEYENLKLKYFPHTNDPIFLFDDSIYDRYIRDNLRIYICEECNNRRNEIITYRFGIK